NSSKMAMPLGAVTGKPATCARPSGRTTLNCETLIDSSNSRYMKPPQRVADHKVLRVVPKVKAKSPPQNWLETVALTLPAKAPGKETAMAFSVIFTTSKNGRASTGLPAASDVAEKWTDCFSVVK